MACPVFVGVIDDFLGRTGPHILPDHSEVIFGTYQNTQTSDFHRYTYPGLGTKIETFSVSAGANTACVGDDGTLYWMTNTGDLYRRADPTSSGSDDLMVNLGSATAWSICWSPSSFTIWGVRHDNGFPPQVWEIDPATDIATLQDTASFSWTGLGPPNVVGTTDGSIWFCRGITLNRYDIASTLIDTTTITTATNRVAATNSGLCIFQSVYDELGELSVVDASMSPTVLACDVLTGVAIEFPELMHGTMDPTGAAFAVMSHYTDLSATGDEVWVWAPAAAGSRWGSVGWAS